MSNQLERKEEGGVLRPKEVLPGGVECSPPHDIIQLRERINGVGKELVLGSEQKANIFREAMKKQEELDIIEQEAEEQALESIKSFFTKMVGSAREKIKEGVDRVLTPVLTKFSEAMPKDELEKLGRSLKRKAMILMTIAIGLQAGIAAAEVTDKQVDDAGKVVATEMMPAEKEVGGKYKYPEDGKSIDHWLKELVKRYDEWFVGYLEDEVYAYNQNHPDDPQDAEKLLATVSEDLAEARTKEKTEEAKEKLPDALHKAREKFRAAITRPNNKLKYRSGSRNIVGLFMNMEEAAKNKDWNKVHSLWDTRADYQPDPGSATQSDFDEYDSIWSDVEELIDYLGE